MDRASADENGPLGGYRSILIPVDFSGPSLAAAELGTGLAAAFGARAALLHVYRLPAKNLTGFPIRDQELEEAAGQAEERLVGVQIELARPGLELQLASRGGEPAEQILAYAEEVRADLIVIGTHGKNGLTKLFVGSVTAEVLRRASCPVVVIREPGRLKGGSGRA